VGASTPPPTILIGDGGGKVPQWASGIFGAENVVRLLASTFPWFVRIGGKLEPREVNGHPGAIFRDRDNKVLNTWTLDVLDGRIQTIRAVINPDKLGHVGPVADAWAVVREAQAAAIAACTAGTPARDVDAAQRRIVEAAGDVGACLHGAGHAIGTEVHEPPYLVPRIAEALEPGHVLTVEPGLYATGVGGIRLEDDVAVTDGEPELLSSLPLELREVPA